MTALKRKLRSRRGASITFALLLFLVCAVVSSVVIVAATAAAGRMSERAQIDQRYYAVSSAVSLLRDECTDVRVVTRHTENASGAITSGPTVTQLVDLSTDTPTVISSDSYGNYPILTDATVLLVQKIEGDTPDTSAADATLALTAGTTVENAALNCTIEEFIKGQSKQMVLRVGNQAAEGVTKRYILDLTLNASLRQSKRESGAGSTVVTTTVEWKLGDIRKGTADTASTGG